MTETLKILGQSAPGATSLTDFYTVGGGKSATVSSIVVCNRHATTAAAFRVSVAPGGAADASSQYIYYDVNIPATETFVATIGVTMAATDVLRCYASTANLTFSAFGVEVS